MLCKMYIIVITYLSYAISYIKVLNDRCICTKRLYTFSHLYNTTLYYTYTHNKCKGAHNYKIYIGNAFHSLHAVKYSIKVVGLCGSSKNNLTP